MVIYQENGGLGERRSSTGWGVGGSLSNLGFGVEVIGSASSGVELAPSADGEGSLAALRGGLGALPTS